MSDSDLNWSDNSPPNLMVLSEALVNAENELKEKGCEFPSDYPGAGDFFEKIMFEEISADQALPIFKTYMDVCSEISNSNDLANALSNILSITKIPSDNSGEDDSQSNSDGDIVELNNIDEHTDLLNFLRECIEQVNELENDLPSLQAKKNSSSFLNSIFRKIHTIKGTAGFFGLNHLTSITHQLENVLDRARNGKLEIDDEVINLLIKGTIWLKQVLNKIMGDLRTDQWPLIINVSNNNSDPIHYGCLAILSRPVEEINIEDLDEENNDKSETMIRISQSYLDQFIGDVGDLLNLAHIFKHSENALVNSNLDQKDINRFKENFYALEDKTGGLQAKLMKLRRVKIKQLLDKVPKTIFKLAQTVGKKVEVTCDGHDVEIDRSMLKILEDPLVHILRNSMDHGFEEPQERVLCGKSSIAKFSIVVTNQQNNVIVTIKDDGRGINGEIIADKALEKGIITQSQVNKMSLQQKQELIFMPGFSSKEVASDISGRGVGMDVVSRKLSEGGGKVQLESKFGEGTTLTLSLPVAATLSTRLILRINCLGKWYGVPMNKIQYLSTLTEEESLNLPKSNNLELFPYRGMNIAIVSLNRIFDPSKTDKMPCRSFIVSEFSNNYIAFEVDEIHEFEIHVLQDFLKNHFENTPFEGASVMGDGSICLMLSFKKILEMTNLDASIDDTNMQENRMGSASFELRNTLIFKPSENAFMISINMELVNRIENFNPDNIATIKGQRIYRTSNGLRQFFELYEFRIGNEEPTNNQFESILILQLGEKQIALGVYKIIDMYSDKINYLGNLHMHGISESWSYNNELVGELDIKALMQNQDPALPVAEKNEPALIGDKA